MIEFSTMARALILSLLATALLAVPLPVKSKTSQAGHASQSANTAQSTSRSKSAGNTKSNTASKSRSAHSKSRRKATAHAAAAPSYQLHPDPDRYRQIQQALADRGYFKGQVNGAWNDDSIEALKHFQADQKFEDTGKLDAHSLTSLGLGPRHDGSTAATVPLSATNPDSPSPGTPLDPSLPAVSELPLESSPPIINPPQ